MDKQQNTGGGIQWGRMVKKLNPYTIRKGVPLSEALRAERVLDPPS